MAAVSAGTDAEYIRLCPTCGNGNAPEIMRCACGALLAGVDLVRAAPASATAPAAQAAAPADTVVCPYDDCGQPNPPGSATCLYCNRPLSQEAAPASLVALPAALRERFRIVRPFPATGAEAEILLVEPLAGGPTRVAKIYRSGIRPKAEVLANIGKIDPKHRVEIFETGVSEGHAWELMEFCAFGSLRERLRAGPLAPPLLKAVIGELATAIADVHQARLVHRDLKPENILVRSEEPLDLVLTDFGTASVLDATQRFTGTARTLPYAAPETLSGVIDAKADYWALGMIVLEAVLGKHPFAGLSEAVVLHHLATRGIDLAGVQDANLKKLLRGLLLRDPKARWGAAETGRWLAGDPSLAAPREQGGQGFAESYHVGDEICQTPEQLAVALSRHWKIGIADLGNGQLLTWFRTVQKDHNTVRLMLEMQHERQLHVDLQLLKLILHLAPGIPPVWRGESIELPAILAQANRALKGDGDAAQWLDALHRHKVLEAYAEAGNAMATDIVQRWTAADDRFSEAWAARLAWLKERTPARHPDEIVHFDDVVFGRDLPSRPPALAMHPRLLAVAYDPAWAAWLRKKMQAETAGLLIAAPWLAELGTPESMDVIDLLVLEALLPEARKAADRRQRAEARQAETAAEEFKQLRLEMDTALAMLRARASEGRLTADACSDLQADLEHYLSVLARIRSSVRSGAEWQNLLADAARIEPIAGRLLELLAELAERRAINAGWLNLPVWGLLLGAILLLPRVLPAGTLYLLLAGAAGIIAWRLLPNRFLKRRIRSLAERL